MPAGKISFNILFYFRVIFYSSFTGNQIRHDNQISHYKKDKSVFKAFKENKLRWIMCLRSDLLHSDIDFKITLTFTCPQLQENAFLSWSFATSSSIFVQFYEWTDLCFFLFITSSLSPFNLVHVWGGQSIQTPRRGRAVRVLLWEQEAGGGKWLSSAIVWGLLMDCLWSVSACHSETWKKKLMNDKTKRGLITFFLVDSQIWRVLIRNSLSLSRTNSQKKEVFTHTAAGFLWHVKSWSRLLTESWSSVRFRASAGRESGLFLAQEEKSKGVEVNEYRYWPVDCSWGITPIMITICSQNMATKAI